MTVFLVVFFVLLALALAVALADRVLATLVEHKASEYLSAPFGHPASVRVHGTPFLTQVLRGRYSRIDVSGGGLQVGEIAGATLSASLHNALLPPRDLIGRRADQLPCEHIEGRMVLPYGEIARVSRIPALTLAYVNDRLIASASLPIPGFNQIARVSGEARLTMADTVVWLRVRGVSVAGINLPGIVINQLLPSLSFPIPLPALPYGLRVDDLTPAASGLVVTGSADDVVLSAP